MLQYSKPAIGFHQKPTEFIPIRPRRPRGNVDRIVNRKRSKSAYRDAQFRPLFRAFEALLELEHSGGTSVTVSTPNHPYYPHTALTLAPLHKRTANVLTLPTETLTLNEEIAHARFWRSYEQPLPRLTAHRLPASWRDLSDVAALEWFHHALRSSGPLYAFTLNLDEATEAKVRAHPSSADWLGKRIARYLNNLNGRKVDFWFVFELSEKRRLHIHGELQIAPDEEHAARKACRLAGGEWQEVRQHQAKTRHAPTVVWANYCAKHSIYMRPLTGRLKGMITRPVNGDWIYATKTVRSQADRIYSDRRKQVIDMMKTKPPVIN
ncbi:hypothetical protein ABFT80_00775 [Mesorhizobium sp. SB112]|uniref:hypothetical protein n=1 Tax=Mesorhizobium sp. SB112 TaxID=3151853 RepID=UPI003265F3C4